MSGGDDEAPQPIYLTLDEVLSAYVAARGEEAGDPRAAVRDWNLLSSALNRPRQAAYYEGADLIRQAATLL